MIPWDGTEVHEPDRPAGCWGDSNGNECGRPAGPSGLCPACTDRLQRG